LEWFKCEPSLNETGTQSLAQFSPITSKDLVNFSSIYFLNVTVNNINNFKKITESKLLNFFLSQNKQLSENKLFLDQNSKINQNLMFYNQIMTNTFIYQQLCFTKTMRPLLAQKG
jgi:hypothetical protein